MEATDRELIQKFVRANVELKRLYDEHIRIEDELIRYGRRVFLTHQEEAQEKTLKRKKLLGVDRMMAIVAPYRGTLASSSEATV